jgi:threonine 3-dehydrogenase
MGGTISLLGLPEGDVNIDFSKNVIFKGITIHGIIGRRVFETWEVMRSLLKSGLADKILEAGFVTHQLPLERFEEGFEAIRNGDGLKVILKPS